MKESFPYDIKQIGDGAYLINEFFSTMYVIVGTQRALVIDCGTGVGDFKAVVQSITKLPYDLVITHAHVDHIGGRGQFDKMYISKTDSKKISSVTSAYRRAYIFAAQFTMERIPRKKITVAPTKKEPEVCLLREGDRLELGGRQVTVYETPGHTNGSLSFVDSKEKLLFSGDVANPILFMWLSNCTTIKGAIPTLERLSRLEGYETVWASHEKAPLGRENIIECLEALKKLSEKKNSILPLIRAFKYGNIRVTYRASHIS